jgi:SAM-dependent methyltransferase
MIYEKFATYYDQFVDYELNDIYYEMITKYYHEGTAIDIGTGTAPLAIKLAQNNFTVTGTDISKQMLERAYNNAVHAGVHLNLYIHNILDPINMSYDVFTMTSDVINYLANEEETLKVFQNISAAMTKDSIFAFDFLTPGHMSKVHNYQEDILLEDDLMQWHVAKTNVPNQIKHTLKFGTITETHYQTTFPLKKYKELLNKAELVIQRKRKTEERIILLCKKR